MIQAVKYLSVLCLKEDERKVVSALQKCGEMMLCETSDTVCDIAESGEELRRIEALRESFKPFEKKKPLFSQPPEVDMERFDNISESDISSLNESEKMLTEINETESCVSKLSSLHDLLIPWQTLKLKTSEIEASDYITLSLVKVQSAAFNEFNKTAEENGIGVEKISDDRTISYTVIAYLNNTDISCLDKLGIERVTLPDIEGSIADKVISLQAEIQTKSNRIKELKEKLSAKLENDNSAELLIEQYKAEAKLESAPITKTEETAVIHGWVPVDRYEKVEQAVKGCTDAYCIDVRDPYDDEEPPVVLRNNKIVKQFEGITSMFSPPRYRGVDPNAVMAPCYWIIFGLMMGDAGYGMMMAVLGIILKRLMKPKGNTEGLFNVIIYSSITSIISGIVFGSYFGEELFPPLLFSSMHDPIKMLIFTLVVGAVHIITALLTAMYFKIKAGDIWGGIFDHLTWVFAIVGIGFLFLPPLKNAGIVLIAIGMGTVLFTAGRAKKNIFGKVTGGLLALYDITGYMSDILSYSRILALGLATGVVGMVMNMLAKMLLDGCKGSPLIVVGIIGAGLIYVVGHVFNLALGLLSAYVHDCRLQYIEFYGKFYEGEGVVFDAFKIDPKLVTIKNNITEEN